MSGRLIFVEQSVLPALTFRNSVFCPQCIFVFCMDLRTNSDYFSIQQILSVFVSEAENVYCAVRTGSLTETDTVSSLKRVNIVSQNGDSTHQITEGFEKKRLLSFMEN